MLINTSFGKYLYTGDAAYIKGNIVGGRKDGVSMPNGYAVGSTFNIIHTLQKIVGILNGNIDHALISHEAATWSQYRSEVTDDGLHIAYATD